MATLKFGECWIPVFNPPPLPMRMALRPRPDLSSARISSCGPHRCGIGGFVRKQPPDMTEWRYMLRSSSLGRNASRESLRRRKAQSEAAAPREAQGQAAKKAVAGAETKRQAPLPQLNNLAGGVSVARRLIARRAAASNRRLNRVGRGIARRRPPFLAAHVVCEIL
jgi:hypothetical protein